MQRRLTHSSYLICGTPRSGTTLLATLLASSGLAGYAREHFSPKNEPPDAARRYVDYVLECVQHGASANGVFGAKLLWNDLSRFLRLLRAAGSPPAVADRLVLESVFPDVCYIWVRREDLVAQAVSWWKAHQTSEWYSGDSRATGAEPVFDFGEIDRLVRELAEGNEGWRRWFADNRIEPFAVRYEDLVRDTIGVAGAALAFVGVELPPDVSISQRTAKQADGVNADWIRRYHELAITQP